MNWLARFETQQYTPEEWTHEAHVRVALAYVQADPQRALERMRTGILKLNDSHGVVQTPERGYHETLTRLWIELVRLAWEKHGRWDPLWAELQDKFLPLRFYSKQRLMSWEARTQWLEPDRSPLSI